MSHPFQPFNAVTVGDQKVVALDGPIADAFGRLRMSQPHTIFDSKQTNDNLPLFWDDAEKSGGGTGSSYNSNQASTTISVGAEVGVRTRQTKMRFNYQPGKSQQIVMTGILGTGASGITQRIGIGDDDNGLFFENIDGTFQVNRRTKTSGSAVNNRTTQTNFNIDKLDGLGPSRIKIDLSKTQIFWIDFEWLSVGRIRFGFVVDGKLSYFHEMNHANDLTLAYMSTPNLPLRYEIENDGAGAAADLTHICTTVISEGGAEELGVLQYESTTSNRGSLVAHINANTADTAYAIVGIKLKAGFKDVTVKLASMSVLAETNDDFEWLILLNPTIAGTFTYDDKTNSAVQTAIGNPDDPSTNNITGLGTVMTGGFANSTGGAGGGGAVTNPLGNALRLGSTIAGVQDAIVLAVRPHTANANIHGGIAWRELS